MRKGKFVCLLAATAAFLLMGCSGSVETGPVPTITPRPTVTPAPTPTPVVIVETPGTGEEEEKKETVYDTKKFKEYYETEKKLPQLKEAYQSNFECALDVLQIDVTDEKRKELVLSQFNALGVKEDLSPKVLMDYEATRASGDLSKIVLDFSGADVILKFAQENKLTVRGPRLITADTPEWAFTKNFDEAQVTEGTDEEGKAITVIEFADPEVVTARMENYIKDVMEYCNTNYPGVVVSWQVLDDPINYSVQHAKKYATNNWLTGIGDDYLVKAFAQARACAAEGQKLFLSQDALDEATTLTPALALINLLKDQNLIDGIAIQAHYDVNSPNIYGMEDMMKALAATGLELHFSEFYVSSNKNSDEDLDKTDEERYQNGVKRYKNLMTRILNYEVKSGYDIISITFDGLTNDTCSLNQPAEYYDTSVGATVVGVRAVSFVYFFDAELNVLDTFFAALGDVSIKAY